MNKYKVVVYAICKNEEKFIQRWYESMKEADNIYVLDTGSTDDTVSKLKDLGVKVKQKLINTYGLGRNGGLLFNKTNSISSRYWDKWGIPGRQTQESESEEVLFSKNGVQNADKYIIGIYIDDDLIKHADDENYKPAYYFLKGTGFDSIREFIDYFENSDDKKSIKVYPLSDLNKQHSVRQKQLDDKEDYDSDFIKAKSIYRHKQKTDSKKKS